MTMRNTGLQIVRLVLAIFAVTMIFGISLALAQTTTESTAKEIHLELNKSEAAGDNCRLSFVLSNRTGQALGAVSYELVVFSKEGVISQMSAFDFGDLPLGKTVVRQFELPNMQCAAAGNLLVNGPSGCEGEVKSLHCSAALSLSSRSTIKLTQ